MSLELHLDYETRSEADLKKVGAFEYANHPTTKILCVSWCLATKEKLLKTPVKSWSPFIPGEYMELVHALCDDSIKIVAHNASFEQVITKYVLSRILSSRSKLKEIPVSRWICTMSLGAALGLPRSLEKAAEALDLPVQKDMEGRRLILKYCKPRTPTKNNPDKWHRKLSDLKRIIAYNVTDVETEKHYYLKLPPLSENERKVWELDQAINQRGFNVDKELIDIVLKRIDEESRIQTEELQKITNSDVSSANQRNVLLKWCNGVQSMYGNAPLPDLRSETVNAWIEKSEDDIHPRVKRVLQIRRDLSKTSTAKYQAFKNRTEHDGTVRDFLVYHAASTGRWAGAGVQPQNFPRGFFKKTDKIVEDLKKEDLETIRFLYGNPFEVFSSCLRGAIIPHDKKEFFCADYASIETRVLFWLAENEDGLRAYENHEDLYVLMASHIFGKDSKRITKSERQLGKTAILGCGYGMGAHKFLLTCKSQGQDIDEEFARKTVHAYRNLHYKVTRFWDIVERMAVHAVRNPKSKVTKGRISYFMKDNFLHCELPSGRLLSYFKPSIKMKNTSWGEPKPTLYYHAIDSKIKKWGEATTYGGKLVENIVQAVARDFMSSAMLLIDKAGYEIVLTVHDEILVEKDIGKGTLKEFLNLMGTVPEWGKGCPIEVEGWQSNRYRK